jgi:nitroreductase
MEFLELAKKRYSVRKYNSKKVENEKLLKILEAARIAPTAANFQPFKLIVLQETEGLAKVSKAANIFKASLAVIVCADHSKAWIRPIDKKSAADIDVSIVTDHMMLQATELGLGSVWICYFNEAVIRSEFKLPDNLEPVNILALGYTDESPVSPDRHNNTRLALSELVSYEKL